MTKEEAIELLQFHGCTHDDIDNIKFEKGFLGMLKWFTGELYEDNYNEVMIIIDTLKEELQSDVIKREVIANLMAICYFSKMWGLDKDGMLRRNNLLTDKQVALLDTCISNITERIIFSLDGINE